jgi:phosphoribosylformylglycinamidine synthase
MTDTNIRVLVLVAAGTNCDRETIRAFRQAGAEPDRVHIRELIDDPSQLESYHIVAIPGGFSYGDDLGAGRIFGNEIRFLIGERFQQFVDRGGLVLGICNGFQVLVRSGLLPGGATTRQTVTLSDNDSDRFECRWTHLDVCSSNSAFLSDESETLFLPVAHAEGKFVPDQQSPGSEHDSYTDNGDSKDGPTFIDQDQVVLKYTNPDGNDVSYPWNPNGSVGNIAAISDTTGRVLGMMPHPERFYEEVQHPRWQRTEFTSRPDGLRIVRNGVEAAANLN